MNLVEHLVHQVRAQSLAGEVLRRSPGGIPGNLARVKGDSLFLDHHLDAGGDRLAGDLEESVFLGVIGVLHDVGNGFFDADLELEKFPLGQAEEGGRIAHKVLRAMQVVQIVGKDEPENIALSHQHTSLQLSVVTARKLIEKSSLFGLSRRSPRLRGEE